MSFYVSTATFFLLHCDELDRVVALPRHKFVTGATLLQLGCGVLKLWSHFCYMLGGVGYSNCGATFTACSEVWSLEIIIDIGRMYKNYSFVKIYYVDGKNIELHGLW